MGKFVKLIVIGVAVFLFISFMGSCFSRCMKGVSSGDHSGSNRGRFGRSFGK